MAHLFSPRWIVACVVLLFSTNVFAVQAVLGVDLGTEYIKAALVKPGIPLEIVLTKDSRRKETSAVAFKPDSGGPKAGAYPERLYGSDAMAISARFPSDVYPNLKTLLGLPANDATVKEYLSKHPALQAETHKLRNTVAFKSKAFTDNEDAWLVEELLAMELQSIQRNAEALAGADTSVRSVVVTVPPFYTIEEKRAVQTAAELVGLKVLSLISDGLAVGLNYATSRQFPVINEGGKPEYHMVFDMGAGSTSATVMKFQGRTVKDVGKFNKTVQEVQVLGSGWDRTLGGDSLNYLIVDDMISQFVETPAAKKVSVAAEDVQVHGRAMAKLVKDAEKVRHVLSANQETGTSFEGLYDDVDFKYKISRATFEALAEEHAARVTATVQKALEVAELDISQLDSIVLHGGASRTPFVQKALEKIAGNSEKLRSNVNSDEAAVFGAGFRAADLSPSFRVKEIRITDGASYPAGYKWTDSNGKPRHQRLWTERSLLGAAAKEITLNNHEDFTAQFYQQVPSAEGVVDQDTKTLTTKNLTASVAQLKDTHQCAESDIHFKLNLRLSAEDGEVEVVKASVECEADEVEKEGSVIDGVKNLFGFGKKEQQPLGEGEESTESVETASTTASTDTATTSSLESSSTSTETATTASSTDAAEGSAVTKKTLVVIPVQFSLEKSGVPQLPKADMTKAKDRIKAFETSDKARRAREDSLNQLEGFTYKVRDLLESETFVAASTDAERSTLEQKASAVSDWLYEDGADAPRDELKARLKELKDIVTPVEKRIKENEERPELVKSLRDSLDQTATFIDSIKKKIAEAEAFSASASSITTTSAESTITEAASATPGDFDGLEDDDFTSSTTTATGAVEDRGPVPPLYTLNDLKEITELSESTFKWLEEKLLEQTKLGENADPVLLVKDIAEKTKKLEKAGMDLAMKAVNNFDSKKGKKSSSKKSSKTKKSSSTKTADTNSKKTPDLRAEDGYIKFGDSDEKPTPEQLEELLKRFTQEMPEQEVEKEETHKKDEL
ncbi:lumenal Hsp70 protein [Neopestalotiopsis sp. 37M]|nr:lumenal Hsp70 protein [Neopestalotiopsis sp. 37M]